MSDPEIDRSLLTRQIKSWGGELGFNHTAIAGINLETAETRLKKWLEKGFHGEMHYMRSHGSKRSRPSTLIPDTASVITVRMDYLSVSMRHAERVLNTPDKGYVSRYALGRDYHKMIRRRLQRLATWIETHYGKFGYRAFCDSAPVMEKPLAEQSGHGWIGKHTNLINRKQGSWFFLGELYTNIPLIPDLPTTAHCGSCRDCMDVCPTKAIVEPYQLDARRCISYLTIELKGTIPVEFRKPMGNRIYGCDDCQLACPWNRYAKITAEPDFQARHRLDDENLINLFDWDERTFEKKTEGSAIRRIGHVRWLRNIAVALGNASPSDQNIVALHQKQYDRSELVREHVQWALNRQIRKLKTINSS